MKAKEIAQAAWHAAGTIETGIRERQRRKMELIHQLVAGQATLQDAVPEPRIDLHTDGK